jgi:RNA polymerase sigma factor (sigma-70 family)
MEPWIQDEARRFRSRTRTTLSQEDAAHEVRCAVSARIDGYDPARGSFTAWCAPRVQGALRNESLERSYNPLGTARSTLQKQSATSSRPGFSEVQDYHLVTEDDYFAAQDALEDQAVVRILLDSLSPRYAQVVRMTFGLDGYPEMDARAMAEVLDVSKETAQKIRQRAMKALEKESEKFHGRG